MSFSALKRKEDAPPPPPPPHPSSTSAKQPPPPRPTTLPPTQPRPLGPAPETTRANARFTDEEVDALLALAPTPTHDTITHALDLPARNARQTEPPSTNIYPKI